MQVEQPEVMDLICMEHLSDFIAGKIVVSMNENMYAIGGHLPSLITYNGGRSFLQKLYTTQRLPRMHGIWMYLLKSCQHLDDPQSTVSKQNDNH